VEALASIAEDLGCAAVVDMMMLQTLLKWEVGENILVARDTFVLPSVYQNVVAEVHAEKALDTELSGRIPGCAVAGHVESADAKMVSKLVKGVRTAD